jgi:hypothetical protein
MSISNDGGPAYPIPDLPMSGNSTGWLSQYTQTSNGMSVRDVLACHALQGMLANGWRLSDAARSCWATADEALAARTEPSTVDVIKKQHERMMAALRAIEPYMATQGEAFEYMRLCASDPKAFESACAKIRDVLANLK